MRKGASIQAITSNPCFEFWLLLHFIYTTKEFTAGEGSNCDLLISSLNGHLPGYCKSAAVFDLLIDKMDTAIEHAKRVMRYHETSGTEIPSTDVYVLVEYLMALKGDE